MVWTFLLLFSYASALFSFFCALNYRTLTIRLTAKSLKLAFGIFTWSVPLDNIESCCLDEIPFLMRFGATSNIVSGVTSSRVKALVTPKAFSSDHFSVANKGDANTWNVLLAHIVGDESLQIGDDGFNRL